MGERAWFSEDTVFRWRVYFRHRMRKLSDTGMPSWLGDLDFHASHRSNLLRKDPEWYGQFGWNDPHDLPYVWPVT